jgi:broad specificity phosphatase PhoE
MQSLHPELGYASYLVMKPRTVRLLLARHGETLANRELRYVGTRDEPLSEGGVAQAERLAEALAPLPVGAVYASPLRRAAETARKIAEARGLALQVEPRLREQAFGEWEGLTRAEVVAGHHRESLLRWEADLSSAPPGGESLLTVQERVLSLVEDLRDRHAGEWVALVSHVGPIKALLCTALGGLGGGGLSIAYRLFLDPGTLSVVDWGERPVVRLFNSHGHLGWEAARWMGD